MKMRICVIIAICAICISGTMLPQTAAQSVSTPQADSIYAELQGPYVQGETEPGKSYYIHKYNGDQDVDIEYVAGNLPIVISVPHGGDQNPREIPNRSGGWFSGVITATDVYTVPLAYEIKDAIYEHTGGYPHIIICRLDRVKVDMNRDKSSSWDKDSRVQIAWNDFHAFIDLANQAAIEQTMVGNDTNTGFGFYIDLHGHTGSRTMIGNAITGYHLNKNDSHINGLVDDSSYEDLFNRYNKTGKSFAKLIRGENSFGGLMEYYGVPLAGNDMLCVPSPSKPNPGGTFYSGHYNLNRHTHLLDGFKDDYTQISGIQLECNTEVRKYHREDFSQTVALTLVDFFGLHYGMKLAGTPDKSLNAPVGVTASDGDFDNKIIVNWNSVTDATYYNVFRSDSADGSYVEVGGNIHEPKTDYCDDGLVQGNSYYYKIKAFNAALESGLSDYDKGSTFSDSVHEVILFEDDFERANLNENWAGDWIQSSQEFHSGSYSVKANRYHDGYFTTSDLDASDATSITIDFWFRKHQTDVDDDILLYYFDGTAYNMIADMDTMGDDREWLHYTDTITDSSYFVDDFKIRLDAHNLSSSYWVSYEKVYFDDIMIKATKS